MQRHTHRAAQLMFTRLAVTAGTALFIAALLAGCTPQQPFYFNPDRNGELSHYIDLATQIEQPDLNERPPSEVQGALRPLSLENMENVTVWNLKLEDAVRNALENSKVIRSLGGALSSPQSFVSPSGPVNGPPTFITQQPDIVPTIYDPALAESSVRPGTTGAPGVEAALALFDAQWATTLVWDRNHTPQNVSPFFSSFSPQDFLQETGQFQTSVTKTSATGATYSVTNTIGYDMDNSTRAFPADWTANVQVQVSQPLLQGAGVEFNRIAGPGATPGINNGVVLARLNTDIALADFETQVRNLVYDVERSLLGTVLRLPQPRRRQGRAQQRLGDLAADSRPLRRRRRRRRGRQGGPGPRTVLPLPQHRPDRPEKPVRSGGQFALHHGAGGDRRAADQAGRRAHHRQGRFRLDGDPHRGPLPQRRTPPPALAGQAGRTGVDRGQELPEAAPGPRGPVHLERHGPGPGAGHRRRHHRQRLPQHVPRRLPELGTGFQGQRAPRFPQGNVERPQRATDGGPGTGQAPGRGAGSVAPGGLRHPRHGIEPVR